MDQNNRYENETKLIGSLFTQTAEGKKVLALLKERYYDITVANPESNPNVAFFNEGSRKVVRDILNATNGLEKE